MATKYNDIVTLRSMRPAYNIKDEGPDDWKTFIANDQFNDLLGRAIKAIRNNDADTHKPLWVAGTYGSGKSHAGAVLKHLFCDAVDDIRDYVQEEYGDPKYAMLRNALLTVRETKRLFPVNMYSQQNMARPSDLSLQLQREVVKALKQADIVVTVKTDFDNYVEHIDGNPDLWQMILEQNEVLRSVAPDLRVLKQRLQGSDTDVFDRLRTALSNTGINVPIRNSNLQSWLFEVQDELRRGGTYDGLLIIWDEFTDVMRSDIGLPVLKILQEISEEMMSPKNDSYFLFLSHPSALNSLKEAEREQTRGRYHYVTYNMEPVSAFRIMSKKFVVVNREAYNLHQEYFAVTHHRLLEEFSRPSADPAQTRQDLTNLFPVHPATANLATYFAREAGSSSRSVFEFLACEGVRRFFDDENIFANRQTITAEYLWDYVQPFFESDTARFGAVTERYNSHHLAVEAQGGDTLAVFKGILLLNALNNIANNDTVTPSEENIQKLFEGTPIYNNVEEALAYFNEKSIIQRQPGGNYSILFTALPSDEIQKIKDELKLTTFLTTEQVIHFGDAARTLMDKQLAQVARPLAYDFFSRQSNEHTLLNRIDIFIRNATPYNLLLAFFVGRTQDEVNELRDIVERNNTDDRFRNLCFVLMETPMGEKNYERFIEYQANATCAQKHSLVNQQKTYAKNASDMITEWMKQVRSGQVTFHLRGDKLAVAGSRMPSTINAAISPEVFSSGPEGLEIIRQRSSNTFWKKASVKATVDAVLSFGTKEEIVGKCGGPAKHIEYLLQDSVDDNLEWKSDIRDDHPLLLVNAFIDQKLHRYRSNNQTFNLGEVLHDLTEPPYGLFQSYAPMGMVAFAMRKYAGKIYDTNGKPRTANHLVDDVVEMFSAWEKGRVSPKLNFMFESKEAGAITKNLISIFNLKKLKGYSDISSLTDARWAITHEYTDNAGYPLWALKHADGCDESLKPLIDNIIRVVGNPDSAKNPQLMADVAAGLKTYSIDLRNLLLPQYDNFQKGFLRFATGIEVVGLKEEEFDNAMGYLKGHLEGTMGLWTEEKVESKLKDWRLSQTKPTPPAIPAPPIPPTFPIPPMPPLPPTSDEKEKRQRAATKALPLASSSLLREMLKDICEQGDLRTIDIILKYVDRQV